MYHLLCCNPSFILTYIINSLRHMLFTLFIKLIPILIISFLNDVHNFFIYLEKLKRKLLVFKLM